MAVQYSCGLSAIRRKLGMPITLVYRRLSDEVFNRATDDYQEKERSRSVTSFYYQSAIDQAAAKVRMMIS